MWSTSTIPVSSCSDPIGRWTATQRGDSCSCICPSARKKSARSRSSMLTKSTRAIPSSSARFHTRVVPTSTPMTPLSTRSAPSTTRREHRASPWKLGSPGTSTRLSFRPCHSAWVSEREIDILRCCSSSSQSATVEPASIVPSRFVSPAWKSSASTSDVLPVPRWPTTATLRIFPGSKAGMRASSSAGRWDANPNAQSVANPELMFVVGRESGPFRGLRARGICLADAPLALGNRRASDAAAEARLQAEDRLRVQLRHARLGHTEHLADLAQGQLLVVVERDHELLPLREPCDRLAERLLHLRLRERRLRLGPLRVLDRVDQGDLVAAGRHGPQFVQRRDRGARDLGQAGAELVLGHAEPRRDLLVRRRAM